MPLSEKALSYLHEATGRSNFEDVMTDKDFEYHQRIFYRAETFQPMVAHPHSPDNVYSIQETKEQKIKIDQVYVGSCTGAKFQDIETFTRIIKGKKVANNVQLLIVPGSMNIYKK